MTSSYDKHCSGLSGSEIWLVQTYARSMSLPRHRAPIAIQVYLFISHEIPLINYFMLLRSAMLCRETHAVLHYVCLTFA